MKEIFVRFSKVKTTHKPIQLDSYPYCESLAGKRVLENILNLFNNENYFDLKFKVENRYIYVHKEVLETNCEYFESKFKESTGAIRGSAENSRIDNECYNFDVYYAFLKHLYTDCIDIEPEKAIDLLIWLMITELKI